MKIVTLGPVYPYKGGISHYMSLMIRALAKKHEVVCVSYKLQYPAILYPGKDQKDYSNDSFKIDGVHYLLNTINPISCFKTATFIKEQTPDLLIVQWWHPFFAPAYWILMKLLKKCKIIFVCHNVLPHEKFPLQRFLVPAVLKNVDAFIVQSGLDEKNLISIIKNPKYAKTPLPTFNVFRTSGISQNKARELLGIKSDERVMLFFGFIREYKGLGTLITAMPRIISCVVSCKLMIVGDFYSDEAAREYMDLIDKSGCGENILLVDGYIPDSEVEKYFAACDIVVLPYNSATQSGIAQIAYGFEKPVIATDVGGLSEVVIDGVTGYLVPPKNPQELASAVVKFFDENNNRDFVDNIKKEAYKYSWDKMVSVIEELYLQLPQDTTGLA
ncbi:glycosyl transferase family 1 [Synergistales bacterium]|nr:glycosyl transferase family 1 [Synergistales bacterium]